MAATEPIHSPTPEEIMEYLDGEGTPATRLAVETHLTGCGSCRSVASEQRGLSAEVRAWQVEPTPLSLRVPARPPGARPQPFAGWLTGRVALVGLAAAAALVVAVNVIDRPRMSFATAPPSHGVPAPAAAMPPALVDPRSTAMTQAAEIPTAPAAEAARTGAALRAPKMRARLGGRAASAFDVPYVAPELRPSDGLGSQDAARRPAIIRTATLRVVAKAFDGVRLSVETIVAEAGGFIDEMTVSSEAGAARTLQGTLRVPSDRLGDVGSRLRSLGQVVEDAQGSTDVSDQLFDIGARVASARATERRMTALLRDRTAELSDVLEVERELARVRVEIERLDAETTNLGRRVSYATVRVTISEERKEGLAPGPLSLASRIRVATADGVEAVLESVAGTILFLLRTVPLLLLWGAVLGSGWLVVRRIQRKAPTPPSP